MKTKLLLSVFLVFSLFTFAKRVSLEQAKLVGKNFYYERINLHSKMNYDKINLQLVSADKSDDPAYFIFNIENNQGYIIVSADDATFPVLGYDFKGSFSFEKMPPALAVFMSGYARQINLIRQNNVTADLKISKKWSELKSNTQPKSLNNVMAVDALLLTEWDQSYPYDAQCPVATSGGDGGHYWVGCVAVSMGQVMKYYNYPPAGQNSHTSYGYANGTGANITINFTNQTYNWSRMPYVNLSGSQYPDEVAKLLYHLGVALNMQWGPDGSGSQNSNIAESLKNHFKYSTTVSNVNKSAYTEANWIALLKSQLDSGKPICYSGRPVTGAGHAWNCDGYQDDTGSGVHFHQNWGWGGSNNGYFLLTELYVPASPGQPAESLMEGQNIVKDMFPASNYPEYCNALKTFTAETGGNFEDGSGNLNYQNNTNCEYLIQPVCGSYIKLNFDEFNVDSTDAIYIYDGATTSDSLLAVFHGGEIPGLVTSSGNEMLVNFVTDGSNTSKGWKANYAVDYCKYGALYQETTGSIGDGSNSCDYRKSSNCTWTIDIPLASSIILDFTAFSLANDADFVTVYKNDMTSANVIKKYGYQSGAMVAPVGLITVAAPRAIIKFFSNSTLNSAGWAVDYSSVISGVNTVENLVSDLTICPNPFTDDTKISFDLVANTNLSFSITNLLGQELYTYNGYTNAGSLSYSLKSLVPDITDGIYFLNLKTDKNNIIKKVICTK